jgi:P2-related tail formation protein
MPDNVIPQSIAAAHIKVYEDIYAQKLSEYDLSVIMHYIVDLAPESVLYYLADQWDVLGAKGWKFADTVEKKRELVRNAVKLNLIIGTPQSIITALNSLGFPDVTIQENLAGAMYNGVYTYNGAINYNQAYPWPYFRVIIGINNILSLTGQMYLDIKDVVLAWKNVRSWLEGLYIGVNENEKAGLNDELVLSLPIGSGIFDDTFDLSFE